MSGTNQVDFIIVGQGLAGAAVSLQLMARNKKILVIDQPQNNTSSKIAAGLFNPITGRKMTKTWMADQLFPYLHHFYKDTEQLTGQQFFYPRSVYRPFLSVEEQNEWMAKSAERMFAGYIDTIFLEKTVSDVHDPFGGLSLDHCGFVDTIGYMKAVRNHIMQTNTLLDEKFDDEALAIGGDHVTYKGWLASKIIFCQGTGTLENKWFNWVPVNPLKGETLIIQTERAPQQIINRGVYIVPSAPNELKVGSTYNYQETAEVITAAAREELEDKLSELVSFPYKVVAQEWGKRPTIPDRRPVIGTHPAHKSLLIFNGMGTKGVSLAPYFSNVLVQWIMGENDLHKEVDVNRYKSLYSELTK